HRDAGLLQQIDGVWSLAKNAERLLPSAVRTLIQRRAARVPEQTRAMLAEAAVLGRSFSLDDLRAVKLRLADDEESDTTTLADALAPAVSAGLLLEPGHAAAADYTFTHEQVREFAAASLTPARRRSIHGAIVELIAGDGDPPRESLSLLARHALAAGDADRAGRFSIDAARAALASRAPEEVLRVVDEALPAIAAAQDRVALLTARDEALDMLRRPADRLEGLAELAALAEALSDSHLELDTLLRRAAALRFTGDEDSAGTLARDVRRRAQDRGDRRAELAACLQLGQAEMRAALGEAFAPSANDVDLAAAAEAYECACRLASELGDRASLAAATRELGVIASARVRAWFVDLVKGGRHLPIAKRIAAGESPGDILPDLPIAPMVEQAMEYFSGAIELYEQLGDRRGLMSSIIAMAYIPFGTQIHLQGSAQRIEEIRRLSTQMHAMSRESERARADAQMLYGVHVFARAKCVADLALSRGREAYDKARMLGDRALEFASAGGVALAHLDLGEVGDAEQWVGRAAAAAAAAPTPLRARQLEMWRGICQGTAGNTAGMRQHLERSVQLATEQGRPAPRCEASAHLALLAARLGAASGEDDLLSLAERTAREVKQIVPLLPGHPLWGARADAALALVALARGDHTAAADAARSALVTIQESHVEDLNLDTVLPAARAVLRGGLEEEQQMVREQLRMLLALIAQRIMDEDVRVRWFRGPWGRELSELAGPLEPPTLDGPAHGAPSTALTETETRLLHLLVEGRTNREIAAALGVSEDAVALQLTEFYAKIGGSSRAEATAFAFRERIV
ncbi:MAG TPA: LuxR C-terminal-related transcriptional regulator, partial [Nitriliruptorales bacterium]|nr:LuxR C-terminal-related transcriptional regulator [Nitriliruptorales bacterium]